MKSIFYLLAALVLALPACSKYEDGPTISVLPRKERIEGKWIAASVKFNNTDSTAAYKDYIWEFTRNYTVILQIGTVKKLGIWSTVTNDNDFRIDYDDGMVEQYEIRKMTREDFWLRDKKTQMDFQLKLK